MATSLVLLFYSISFGAINLSTRLRMRARFHTRSLMQAYVHLHISVHLNLCVCAAALLESVRLVGCAYLKPVSAPRFTANDYFLVWEFSVGYQPVQSQLTRISTLRLRNHGCCHADLLLLPMLLLLFFIVSYVSLFRLSNAKFNLYDVLIVFAAATTFIIHNHFVHFDCFRCCSFCRFSRILMFFYSFIVLSVIYDLWIRYVFMAFMVSSKWLLAALWLHALNAKWKVMISLLWVIEWRIEF